MESVWTYPNPTARGSATTLVQRDTNLVRVFGIEVVEDGIMASALWQLAARTDDL